VSKVRPIKAVAADIAAAWGGKVNYAARPYLEAMHSLETVNDSYWNDSGVSIVAYFLANASTFRGEDARRLKAELRAAMRTGKS